MALLASTFPQYASFEPFQQGNYLMPSHANQTRSSSDAAFGGNGGLVGHHSGFPGIDFNHHMSGEIDRVFGGASGIAAAGAEFDGLYKNATIAVDNALRLQRASSGSLEGSLVGASLNSAEYPRQPLEHDNKRQKLAQDAYLSRGGSPFNAPLNNRKRSSESMEDDGTQDGPLPDGITPEEE
jgi:hypothetical protein